MAASARVRVTIVQPYVPRYRATLFRAVAEILATEGYEVRVAAPSPTGTLATRGDEARAEDWQVKTRSHSLSPLGRRGPTFHHFGGHEALARTDIAVVPAMATCWDSWRALRRRSGLAVGLWGHIGNYTSTPRPLDVRLERRMMARADLVMAYTSSGGDVAVERGVPAQRVQVLGNTNDTGSLETAVRSLTLEDVANFRGALGLDDATPTFALLGGLDESKNLGLVRDWLSLSQREGQPVRLLVGGEGHGASILQDGVTRGQVSLLGYADERVKALMAASSRAFVNPGRIGLLAVDALVLGRPIVAAPGALHGPEVDYLEEGVDLVTLPSADPAALQSALFSTGPTGHRRTYPTIDQLIGNFCEAIRRLENARTRV